MLLFTQLTFCSDVDAMFGARTVRVLSVISNLDRDSVHIIWFETFQSVLGDTGSHYYGSDIVTMYHIRSTLRFPKILNLKC